KLMPLRLRLPATPPSADLNPSAVPQTLVDSPPAPTEVGVTSLPLTSRVPDRHIFPPTLTLPGLTPGASVKFKPPMDIYPGASSAGPVKSATVPQALIG